jgi:hypothetical protein
MKGHDLRDAGITRVSIGREDWLAKARRTAMNIASRDGSVSINQVRLYLDLPDDCSPNLWGAVFKSKDFEAVDYCQATHPSAHARVVRVYKLKEQA